MDVQDTPNLSPTSKLRRATSGAAAQQQVTVTRELDRWRLLRFLLGVQGLFYLLSGAWPFAHLRSFSWVLGGLTVAPGNVFQFDLAAGLIITVGVVLLLAALRARPDWLLVLLAVGANGCFIALDIRNRHTISAGYWADFAVAALLTLALLVVSLTTLLHERRRGH
jgi:hypothetical protein